MELIKVCANCPGIYVKKIREIKKLSSWMTSWLRNLSPLADEGGGGFSNLGTKSSHDDVIAVCYIIVL